MKVICKVGVRMLLIESEVLCENYSKTLNGFFYIHFPFPSYLALNVPYKTSNLKRISVKLTVNMTLGKISSQV